MRKIAVSLLTCFAATSWASDAKPKAIVFVRPLKKTELFSTLSYPARVVPNVSTTILADTDGIISTIKVSLGQNVRHGQALIRISHADPVYQYAPMTISSPARGVVSLMDVTEGSQVVKGQRLAIITDPTHVKMSAEVPAQDLKELSRGAEGTFEVSGAKGVISVRIKGISPYVDPATGTASCELELVDANSAKSLNPGILGQVSFKIGVHSGFNVPDQALVYKGSKTFVRVVESGKSKQIPVALGARERGFVEITDGLGEGMVLVERASRYVSDGEEVTAEGQDGK